MRKLTMLAASALTALAFAGMSATTASADVPFWLYDYPSYEECTEVTLVDGEVSGNCWTEDFEGSFQLGVFTPGWNVLGDYDSTFDLVIGPDGSGYAANPTVAPTPTSWPRVACDAADGTPLPWPAEARAPNTNTFLVDITIGLRVPSYGPGGPCVHQEITVRMTRPGRPLYLPQAGMPVELEQEAPSTNIDNGHWDAPSLGMDVLA